jgi:hypothetical protein
MEAPLCTERYGKEVEIMVNSAGNSLGNAITPAFYLTTPTAGAPGEAKQQEPQKTEAEKDLMIAQKQLSDLQASLDKDMAALNKAQHKFSRASTWENRFGKISAKAGRISLPAFIASLVTNVAASFVPVLAPVATVASAVCTGAFVGWLGGLGASKLFGHFRKNAEKDIPALTTKVQEGNKKEMDYKARVDKLARQVDYEKKQGTGAPAPSQQSPASSPPPAVTALPVKAEAVKEEADDDPDTATKTSPGAVTDTDEGFVDIGGIRLEKEN